MNVTILNKTITLDNNDIISQIQTHLDEILINKDKYFSHMIIDNIEIYSDYELYIDEKRSEIKEIIVVVKTTEELLMDIFTSIKNYANGAMAELNSLADVFYQTMTSETWLRFRELLEAIEWLNGALKSIDQEKTRLANPNKWLLINSSLEVLLPNLLEALESQDNILIADIITHEIIPLFEELIDIELESCVL